MSQIFQGRSESNEDRGTGEKEGKNNTFTVLSIPAVAAQPDVFPFPTDCQSILKIAELCAIGRRSNAVLVFRALRRRVLRE